MDGLLTINKEVGWTSHDVVAKIRQVLGGIKVGHAGTLDPAATGVLPVLLGRGTRIAEYLVEWDKEYRAVLRLGESTDTQDGTGTILARRSTDGVTTAAIHEAVGRFRGVIEQVPPMYSAVKVSGVPLYRLARAGKTVVRETRKVFIHFLDILEINERDITLRVGCSKGTYVRTLCADLGTALGVGGHLLSLERCRVGPLTLDQAVTVDEVVIRQELGCLREDVRSLDEALQQLPIVKVDGMAADRVRHGVPVPLSQILPSDGPADETVKPGQAVRIQDGDGRLLAIGKYAGAGQMSLAIEKVLVGQEE
jgi:tRNA pseudouridine55 synthase